MIATILLGTALAITIFLLIWSTIDSMNFKKRFKGIIDVEKEIATKRDELGFVKETLEKTRM